MVKDSVGVIFGKTGSLEFRFAVSGSDAVKRGDYVKVWHEVEGWTLAQVVSITRSSGFSVDDAVGVAAGGKFTADKGEQITSEAIVVGCRDENGVLRVPKTPFSPGDKVFLADKKLITETLGLTRGEIYIGLLEGQDIEVKLDANNLVQKHCSILAKTGSGKSYTAGVLLEELLDREIPLLIIDPHGEYATLKYPSEDEDDRAFEKYGVTPQGYASQVTVYTPADKILNPGADKLFRLNGLNLTIKDFTQMFADDRSTQTGILYEAISKLKAEKDIYTLDDIIFEVGQDKSKAKWNVISKLEALKETGLFSEEPTRIEELVQNNRAAIIDMKGVDPTIQAMIVAKICSELFEARKMGKVPPGMLVIEEAHNFCPEKGFERTVCTDILRTIASEGRKFGLGLTVISQRPARVDKNILSQCNTQIILRVTNPNDLKAISKGIEGITGEVEEELKRLPMGVAMLVSNYIERPILVDVRVRKSKHGGASTPILKNNKQKKKKTHTKNKVGSGRDDRRGERMGNERGLLRKIFGG